MVSLAKTPAEVKQDTAEMPAMAMSAMKSSAPEYPCGCCISLDDETLTKLGIGGDMPAAGETMRFTATAKVTCASVRDEIDASGAATQCKRVELQIVDMDVMGSAVEDQVAKSEARRKRFYGGGEPDGDEG